MLEKLKAIWQYIRDNNVWPEMKDRFMKVLQWFKDGALWGVTKWLASLSPHQKVLKKIWVLKDRPPLDIKNINEEWSPLWSDWIYRIQESLWRPQMSKDNLVTNKKVAEGKLPKKYAEIYPQQSQEERAAKQRAAREKKRDAMSPAEYEAARKQAAQKEMDILRKRWEAGEFDDDYRYKALSNF